MSFALDIARQSAGQTSPNPTVGAVVVKQGEIVGFASHLKAGEAHAEVNALHMAGEKAKGATIYITLEPCSHDGKTPPCTDLIIGKGIKRAVIAVTDPNEKVAGTGMDQLHAAGIEVKLGVLAKEAKALNVAFFHYITTKRPYVTVKAAISLDGKIATATGDSKWITGASARLDSHHYRQTHDAILVGIETVLADNPSLTTRLPGGGKNPTRIILDTNLRTPLNSKVITDQEAKTWIIVGGEITEQAKAPYQGFENVSIIQVVEKEIEIDSVLRLLGQRHITSLFVEGGATINASFLETSHINQLILYMAPKIIGGQKAPTSFAGSGFQSIAETLKLEVKSVEMIEQDIKIVAGAREEDSNVHRNY